MSICQWCITDICAADLSPHQIIHAQRLTFQQRLREQIEREILYLSRNRCAPPSFDTAKFERIDARALEDARSKEGPLQSLYRSFVDNSERQASAMKIATLMREQALALHQEALRSHSILQREIESSISRYQERLLCVAISVAEEVKIYIAESLSPSPTKSKDVKLLRAHAASLVNSDGGQIARPADIEYEALKQSVREEDCYKCVCCGRNCSTTELHVHHVIPLFQNGTNHRRNLVTLCYSCHNKQHPGFKVTRNQPIRRKPAKKAAVAATDLFTVIVTAAPQRATPARRHAIPRSRKGWMDCPNCLSAIQLAMDEDTICPECGWTNEQ
jgi:5-methylcytosine-specific restriction endonuclease McrA